MNDTSSILIYGKSEFISAANRQMKQAFSWYERGYEKEGNECAKEAVKLFETAKRCDRGAYMQKFTYFLVR